MSKLAHSHQATMDLIEARSSHARDMDDEATQFAAALLIPEECILADLLKVGPRDIDDDSYIEKLARKYQVTIGLMKYRLRRLAAANKPCLSG